MTNDELLTKNMELAGVIRALRANAREDAKRIEELERERDEAREKLRKTRKFLEDANRGAETNAKIIQIQLDKISRLRRESEEARAFIEELVDLVAYGLGQHASIWSQAAMTKAREAIAKAKTLGGAK